MQRLAPMRARPAEGFEHQQMHAHPLGRWTWRAQRHRRVSAAAMLVHDAPHPTPVADLVMVLPPDHRLPAFVVRLCVRQDQGALLAERRGIGRQQLGGAQLALALRAVLTGRIPPPGIGKSRAAREAAALAMDRGVEVVWSYYESHARDIPFHVVTNLLRAGIGVRDPDGAAGRARIRERVPDRCAQTTASYAKSRRRCRLPRDQVAIPR